MEPTLTSIERAEMEYLRDVELFGGWIESTNNVPESLCSAMQLMGTRDVIRAMLTESSPEVWLAELKRRYLNEFREAITELAHTYDEE